MVSKPPNNKASPIPPKPKLIHKVLDQGKYLQQAHTHVKKIASSLQAVRRDHLDELKANNLEQTRIWATQPVTNILNCSASHTDCSTQQNLCIVEFRACAAAFARLVPYMLYSGRHSAVFRTVQEATLTEGIVRWAAEVYEQGYTRQNFIFNKKVVNDTERDAPGTLVHAVVIFVLYQNELVTNSPGQELLAYLKATTQKETQLVDLTRDEYDASARQRTTWKQECIEVADWVKWKLKT